MSLPRLQTKCRRHLCSLAFSHVSCPERLCTHTMLVLLHLSPQVTNSTIYRRLVHRHEVSSSTCDSDSDDDASPCDDATLRYQAEYVHKNHRYPEESQRIRDLVDSKRHECPIVDCPTRWRTGRGAQACEHTFPLEFRPPAPLTTCPRCGERFSLACLFRQLG